MEKLFLNIVNISITAGWLILAILLLRIVLKKAPRWIHCVLWGLVGLRLAFPFSLESVFSLIPSRHTLPDEIIYTAQPQIQSGIPYIDRTVHSVFLEPLTVSPSDLASINPTQLFSFVFSWIWFTVMIFMILRSSYHYVILKWRMEEAILIRDNIKQSPRISSPFVLGFFRPSIYLPYTLPEEDVPYILAHEQAHIRRSDHLWKPFGYILLCIHWFNPLMWIAYHLLCKDIETACDEKVIQELDLDNRRAYSTALLNCSIATHSKAVCPLAFGEVSVKDRVKNVMHYKKPSFWIVLLAALLCIITAVCFLTDPKTFDTSEKTERPEMSSSQPLIYWSVPVYDDTISDGHYMVSLQDGVVEETLEIHVQKGTQDWNVLTLDISYDFESAEEIMIDTFEDILGHNGFRIYRRLANGENNYYCETYYFAVDEVPIYLADSWGDYVIPNNNAFTVDLDGDGYKELICNVTYMLGGFTDAYIYHWNGEFVETYYGTQVMKAAEEPFYIIPTYSTYAEYLPENNTILAMHWDSKTGNAVSKEYEIDLQALKQWLAERPDTDSGYSPEMALDKLRAELILAYQNTYGEYIPAAGEIPDQSMPDSEYLTYVIPNLSIKEETDLYYVISVIWDFWVDKKTGQIYKYYNGINPMLIPFDYTDPNALMFAG